MTAAPFSFGSRTWPGLAKIVEEAGETQQVIGKFFATFGAEDHWDGTNLRSRLEDELADLRAAIDFVVEHNDLDVDRMAQRTAKKRVLFESWQAEHLEPEPESGHDLGPTDVETLAAALYRLEWDTDLYATPRGAATDTYERRARRLMSTPTWSGRDVA